MIFIEVLIFCYVAYVSSYVFFFGFGGLFYRKKKFPPLSKHLKFAVLVPGYKEDQVIIGATERNLQVNYPEASFDLYVIADSFEKTTLAQLDNLPCQVIEVSFEKSTKVKALKRALEVIDQPYDYLVVLDADNVIEKEYLNKVNYTLQNGKFRALQTQRVPKNKNNSLAVLDGISEAINNHIYRQGAAATGFSVSLNGSGMVFDFSIFKETIKLMDSVGGFDRELEFRLLEKGVKVGYLKEAWVFDEKTDEHNAFQNQRKRWISSQYVYLRKYFMKGLLGLLRGHVVYFHSTVWRNIQLPRLINIGLVTIITLLSILLTAYLVIPMKYWVMLWAVYMVSTLVSIPKEYFNRQLLQAIIKLPKLLLTMIGLMFKLKGANKKFIHTPHKTNQ